MSTRKPKFIGINHVALEVSDIDEALEFYGRFFEFTLQSRSETMAFIEMGDQFIALSTCRSQARDNDRHFGLVVDQREGLREKLEEAGVEIVTPRRLDFMDPWGNRIEIVPYEDIQFVKQKGALKLLGAEDLRKTDAAKKELRAKGIERHLAFEM
ncbi:MAG: VOC family protein [Pseudomonadota bacterium]